MTSTIKICIETDDNSSNDDCVVKLVIPSDCSDITIKCNDSNEVTAIKNNETPKKKISRNSNKELIFKHIQDNNEYGTSLPEIRELMPSQTRDQVQHLLRELKADNRISSKGRGAFARWHING